MTHLIYEDEEIVALWTPGESAGVLITFGDLITLANGTRFFADKPVRAHRMTCLGFMAKRPNWFPAGSVHAGIAKAHSLLAPYSERLVYGGSMGGYAAIKFSRALDATGVVAMCPQWTIDSAETDGFSPGWQRHFVPSMKGMGVRRDEIAGRIRIVYDPHDPIDRFHFQRLQEREPRILGIPMPFVGHHATTVLAGSSNLMTILAALRDDDLTHLRKVVNSVRRGSPIRALGLFRAALQRHPQLAVPLARHRLTQAALADGHVEALYLPLLAKLLSRHPEQARAYVATIDVDELPLSDQHKLTLARAVVDQRLQPVTDADADAEIETHHRTWLCYDALTGVVVGHPLSQPRPPQRIPVRLIVSDDTARLRISFAIDGIVRRLWLPFSARGMPTLQAQPGSQHFAIELVSGRRALRAHGRYLCAEPGGRLTLSRDTAEAWELFRFVPTAGEAAA